MIKKASEMNLDELSVLAYECGILVLKKMVFDRKTRKFVFDDFVLDGDLIALKQFVDEVVRLEHEL